MPWQEETTGRHLRRALSFAGVLVLHVALIWALANGLARDIVEIVREPVEVRLLDAPAKPKETPPAPPRPVAAEMPVARPVPPKPAQSRPLPHARLSLSKPQAQPEVPPKSSAPAEPAETKEQPAPFVPPRENPDYPRKRPPYPPASRRLQEEGRVVVSVHVTAAGEVSEVRLDKSSGYARLDKAVMEAARKSWRFLPATRGGVPVDAWFECPVIFRLDEP